MSDWCILRTSGRNTLRLAQTLVEDGFEAWTPAKKAVPRRARWNARRDVRVPIIAGFVFAKARHLQDLLEMSSMPVKPRRGTGLTKPAHASFSVLRDPMQEDGFPVVADSALTALREAEIPAKIRRRWQAYSAGAEVNITEGSFEGLAATVERSDRSSAIVWVSIFGRHQRVKLPTSILKLKDVYREQSDEDGAARKAA